MHLAVLVVQAACLVLGLEARPQQEPVLGHLQVPHQRLQLLGKLVAVVMGQKP